jgi:hypothetical protein
VIHDWGEVVTR